MEAEENRTTKARPLNKAKGGKKNQEIEGKIVRPIRKKIHS